MVIRKVFIYKTTADRRAAHLYNVPWAAAGRGPRLRREMFRRIAVAAVALAAGAAVSAGLLAYSSAAGAGRDFLAAAHDLPVGAALTADSVEVVRVIVAPAQAAALLAAPGSRLPLGSRTTHQLTAGQLILRGDLEAAGSDAAASLVAVPIKDLPPIRAGDRVDLFVLSGAGDRSTAQPFAWAVPVAAVTGDGLVLRVAVRQELAFVYAAGALRLAAVVSGASLPPAALAPITSPDQALAAVS